VPRARSTASRSRRSASTSTKEQADYNLKYLSAVALLDGGVGPDQLENDGVLRGDVQDLLARVDVGPAADLTADYPRRTAAWVRVLTHDGREFSCERADYEGSPTRPMTWERVVDKFEWLAEPFCDGALRADIVAAVEQLDAISIAELTALLGAVSPTARCPRSKPRF